MGSILDNATIGIRLGGVYNGTTPNFTGTPTPIIAKVRRYTHRDGYDKVNVAGARYRKSNRYANGEASITLEGVVGGVDFNFRSIGSSQAILRYIEITVLPKSAMTTPDVFVGVIYTWEHSGQASAEQLEMVEIDLDPDIEA